jgi:tetratricopeptide (TPR) repeat protein
MITVHAHRLEHTGRSTEAEAAYLKSVSLHRRLAEAVVPGESFFRDLSDPDPVFVTPRNNWANSLIELAWFHSRRGKTEDAAHLWTEARSVFEGTVAAYHSNVEALQQFAWALAVCPLENLRDPARAVRLARKAALHKEAPLVVTLGAAQYRAGDYRAALANLDFATRFLTNAPPKPESLFFRAMAHWRLGNADVARRDYDEGVRRLPRPSNVNDHWYDDAVNMLREEAAALLGLN